MMKRIQKAFSMRPVLALCVAAVAFGSVPVVSAWAAKGDLESVKTTRSVSRTPLEVIVGKADVVELPGAVADIMVADSSVVNVQVVQATRLYVVGMRLGNTNIIALDDQGNVVSTIDVHVTNDYSSLQDFVKKMFPDEAVRIESLHGQLYLTGQVSTPEKASKIVNVVGHYVSEVQGTDNKSSDQLISNLLEVKGEQQVMLQVKVLEASRSFIRELGIKTANNDLLDTTPETIFGGQAPESTRGGNASLSTVFGSGVALANDPAATFRVLTDSGIFGIGTLGIFIDALEDEDLVSVLAEPNLTAISGQQAGFLAGGEFPVPVGRDQVGNLVIDYREFGVSLNFRPVVMSSDRISLQLNTEVSSLDFVNSVSAGDLTVPGLDVRRAETTVELPSGGSLMIAGLLQSDMAKGMAGLPGIRKTPILGDLISSKSFERNETELVVIISAYMVEPFKESTNVKKVPKQNSNELAQVFAKNIRRQYTKMDGDVFNDDLTFGYLLD